MPSPFTDHKRAAIFTSPVPPPEDLHGSKATTRSTFLSMLRAPTSASRASLEPTPTSVLARLGTQFAISGALSTPYSVDAAPADSRLRRGRGSPLGGSPSPLRAPLVSLSQSSSFIAPSPEPGRASREGVDKEGESQAMNVSGTWEIGAGGGSEGTGGSVIDVTISLTIRSQSQSHSRPGLALDKLLPTPPLRDPATLPQAIRIILDVKPSSPPGATAIGLSPSHLTVSPSLQQATPDPSSFLSMPIMDSPPLFPMDAAECPSTVRAQADAVEISGLVSTLNPDGQGVTVYLELKGAVEQMRATVDEPEKGLATRPVAFEIPTEGKGKPEEEEKTVLGRSDAALVAVFTPQSGDVKTLQVLPPPPDPDPTPKQSPSASTSALSRVNPPTPSSTVVVASAIAKNKATHKVQVHGPGAQSHKQNTHKHAPGPGNHAKPNAIAHPTGEKRIHHPHDEGGFVSGRRLHAPTRTHY